VTIAFRDLRRETAELQVELRATVDEVLAESRFVGGDAVASFESEFAEYCGAAHAVGVGSGTDAIAIALRSAGIGAGDEVITAANTCVPTVAGIVLAGATPVLADIDPRTFTLDPDSAAEAVGPRTRALVPVHLYGRRADMQPLLELAREHGLRVIEDAAQAHGAAMVADVAAFSFYPTKNLGALGDAGAVVTSDTAVAAKARELREYGRHGDGRSYERSGQSRLDTIQAALLLAKLPLVDGWNARRSELAGRYTEALGDGPVEVPTGVHHVYHLYVVRSPERDALRNRLRSRGVETLVHYPLAVHQHPAWSDLARPGALGESERAAREVLSLPLYPQLTDDEAGRVIEAVLA
jgi:dTDP-3-amino-3,4,6-trideoxy-alpha-D-glucose transaminase